MIFLSSPYVNFETEEDAEEFGLLGYSPADGETEEDAEWILTDSEDVWLTLAQAIELAAWANERFAGDNYKSFAEGKGLDELVAQAQEMMAKAERV